MIDYNNISGNKNFYKQLPNNIWLMDDHKWAFFAWWKYFSKIDIIKPYTLIHIDYHWDAINDFDNSTIDKLSDLNNEKVMDLLSIGFIRKDSFIAPAIILGYFKKIHFYCKQFDNQIGFYQPFLDEYNVEQIDNRNYDFLKDISHSSPCIFDIDLDIFNKSDMWAEGDLWNDDEIDQLILNCKDIIKNSKVVTIALSFNYSGDINGTRKLASRIIPIIIDFKKEKV